LVWSLDREATQPTLRGVNPVASIYHGKRRRRWIVDELLNTRSARFPFGTVRADDKFREALGDHGRRVGLAIALHWRAQKRRRAPQNVYGAIFGVATQTNHRRNIEIEFQKRFGQSVGRPILFLAGDAGARTE